MAKDKTTKLTDKQMIFCREYIFDWNATRSYKEAYPDCKTDDSARAASSLLLTNINITDYLKEIQKDLEKQAGISRQMVLNEHMKLAFSSIAHLHNTWIERKEFDELTDVQKSCISEISTQIKTTRDVNGNLSENEYIKVKLYDKQKSLDSISKMLGYNEAEKHQHSGEIKGSPIVIQYKGKEINLSE